MSLFEMTCPCTAFHTNKIRAPKPSKVKLRYYRIEHLFLNSPHYVSTVKIFSLKRLLIKKQKRAISQFQAIRNKLMLIHYFELLLLYLQSALSHNFGISYIFQLKPLGLQHKRGNLVECNQFLLVTLISRAVGECEIGSM